MKTGDQPTSKASDQLVSKTSTRRLQSPLSSKLGLTEARAVNEISTVNQIETPPRWRKKEKSIDIDSSKSKKLQQRRDRFSTPTVPTTYGFVSRGEDSRLIHSESARIEFFDKTLAQFISYCNQSSSNELSKKFQTLLPMHNDDRKLVEDLDGSSDISSKNLLEDQTSISIESILSSLRKLREALLPLDCDAFSIKVFLFSVRLSANFGHYQTYIPSINYLLDKNISAEDKAEIGSILVLHASHFNNDNSRAITYLFKYVATDLKLKHVLLAWIQKDYCNWVKLYNTESDSGKSSVMRFGLKNMIRHITTCISASYYNLKITELNQFLPKGVTLEVLKKDYGVDWELTDSNVAVRKRLAK